MTQKPRQVKNLKISVDAHNVLKSYCDKKGIKIYRFLENIIFDNCSENLQTKSITQKKREKENKDIYGED